MTIAFVAGGSLDTSRPDPAMIALEDIALGLSRLYRWRGACPITVAQHSVVMAREASTEAIARWCLLHDASEAWCGDLPSLIKHRPALKPYRALEERILSAVAERFGLTLPMPAEVKQLDHRALRAEVLLYLPHARKASKRVEPLPGFVDAWSPARGHQEFLREARRLGIE